MPHDFEGPYKTHTCADDRCRRACTHGLNNQQPIWSLKTTQKTTQGLVFWDLVRVTWVTCCNPMFLGDLN